MALSSVIQRKTVSHYLGPKRYFQHVLPMPLRSNLYKQERPWSNPTKG